MSHDRRQNPCSRVSEGRRVHSVPLDLLYAQKSTMTILHPWFDFDSTHQPSLDASVIDDTSPVTTHRATPPRRLPPYPFLHKSITFRRVFSACFHRLQANVDRLERILGSRTSDDASGPPLIVSRHFRPFSRRLFRRLSGRGPIGSQAYHRRVFPWVVWS